MSVPEIQGWYSADNDTPRVRVRTSVEGRFLALHDLAGALMARWSLDQLENRSVPIFGRDWVVGDRRLPEPSLALENDRDYAALRAAGATLLAARARTWRQLLFAAQESGNITGWPIMLAGALLLIVLWATGWPRQLAARNQAG